jgi:drug/metabolite transporter (DMT)-like permease
LLGIILGLLGIIFEAGTAFADVGTEPNPEDIPNILGLFFVVIILTLCGIGVWYLIQRSRREK